MLLIFGNCISLALYNPMEPEDSEHNSTLTKFGAQRDPVRVSAVPAASSYVLTAAALPVLLRMHARLLQERPAVLTSGPLHGVLCCADMRSCLQTWA